MKIVIQTFLVGIAASAAIGASVAIAASGDVAEQVYVAPRGPNGQPDLNGVWQV